MKRTLYVAAIATALAIGGGAYLRVWDKLAPQSTFVLLDGSSKTTADLRGKVTLVNFWATSCASCLDEMPRLVATHNKYHARGFETLAVAMSYDPPSYVVHYAQTRKLPFDVAIDNTGAVAQAWGPVEFTPSTFIVDRRGRIAKQFVGEPDFSELNSLIESLLAQSS